MSNDMTLFQQETGAQISTKFQALQKAGLANDLGEGIRGSYGILSIKGGRFAIKYKGQTHLIMAPPTQPGAPASPVSFIDIVIVKANAYLNKQWYKGNYVEGSTEQPDCYSLDGKAPSQEARSPQSASCALCPKNQFGSKIGDNGQKQKACRDTKKLAIVPLADIPNLGLGGALLFRVPPSGLKELSIMSDKLKGRGYTYNAVAVRVTFDTTVSHPKPLFNALRPLTDVEADQVIELFTADNTDRILADQDAVVEDPETAAPHQQAQQPQPVAMPQAPQAAPQAPQPAAATGPAPMPLPPMPGQPVGLAAVGTVAVQMLTPGLAAPPPAPPPPPASAFTAGFAAPVAGTLQLTPEPAPQPAAAPAAKTRTRRQPNPVAAPATLQLQPETIAPVAASPAEAAGVAAPTASQLDSDINSILSGLSAFGGSK